MRFETGCRPMPEDRFWVKAVDLGFYLSGTFVRQEWNYTQAALPGYGDYFLRVRDENFGLDACSPDTEPVMMENLLEGMAFIKGKVLADNLGREMGL